MPNLQTQAYIRNYVQESVKNGIMNFVIRTVARALELIVTLAVGYEVSKITSDEKKDVWSYVEFFAVLTLCMCIWVVKCCCVNKFCVNCCIKCFNRYRNRDENIELENANDDENEPAEKLGPLETVLQKLHMILNRLAIGAIGFEIRKQLFKFKPLTTWDYVEISAIALFCIWILTVKYCVLKCHCLKLCCCFRCVKGCCLKKHESVETQSDESVAQNGLVSFNHGEFNENVHGQEEKDEN